MRGLGGTAILVWTSACGRFGFGSPDQAGDASNGVDVQPDAVPCVAPCFSDTFDVGPLGATWSGFTTTMYGNLSLSTDAVSPPSAMQASVSTPATAQDRQALLQQTIPAMRSISCAFDLEILQESTTERARFLSLFVDNTIFSGYELNIWIQMDGTTLLEEWGVLAAGGSFINGNPGAPLATNKWIHIDFSVDYSGASRLYADGSPIAAITMNAQTPTAEHFMIGMRADNTGAWAVAFDNVRCTPQL